jgi:hypothetical protein
MGSLDYINIGTLIDSAVERVLPELKESIGLPYTIESMPLTFNIKTP